MLGPLEAPSKEGIWHTMKPRRCPWTVDGEARRHRRGGRLILSPLAIRIYEDLCSLENSLALGVARRLFQFERLGYFFTDPIDSNPGRPVFDRTATLRDTWAKEVAKE
jgi:hypothetical protein